MSSSSKFGSPSLFIPSCSDVTEFTSFLLSSRKSDDNIILSLNKTDGSINQCSQLWKQFLETYAFREKQIQKCISEVEVLTSGSEVLDNNLKSTKHFSPLPRQLSFLKSELEIDSILKTRAIKLFKIKCPGFRPLDQTWTSYFAQFLLNTWT